MRVNFGFRVSACTSKDKSESRFRVLVCGFRVSACASEDKPESWFRLSGFERRNQFSGALSGSCLLFLALDDRGMVTQTYGLMYRKTVGAVLDWEHENRASENGVSDRKKTPQ